MSTAGKVASLRHQRRLPAYVAAIILGVVGMHVLMQHCSTLPHSMTPAPATTEMVEHHGDEHFVIIPVADAAFGTVHLVEEPANNLDEMLMLCAAMLLGAGAVLALLLRRRMTQPLGLSRQRLIAWRPALPIASTGPPQSLAFAVIRC